VNKKLLVVLVAALALVSFAATAAKTKVFEFPQAGFRLSWSPGVAMQQREGKEDLLFEGSFGSIKLKAIVRKGAQLPAVQHEYRLMSYFAGQWTKTEEACRGTGWTGCESWSWHSESGDRAGVGEVGYGPGGTYIFVLSAPLGSFKQARPAMRLVQQSIQLF
jgi:hypothetical protein